MKYKMQDPCHRTPLGDPVSTPASAIALHQCSAMRQLHPHRAAEKLSLPKLTGPVFTAYCRWAKRLREGLAG